MSSAVEHPFRQVGDVSGAVRSIRVAAALNERFGQLLRKKQYRSNEEMTSVLGEARQVYPEIWSNLDDARKALMAIGMKVDAYDALRASPAAHDGGVLDVQVSDQTAAEAALVGGGTKTAYMYTPGHAAATEACNVMRAALPQVDWDALDRADATELEQFGSLGPARWKKVAFYAFVAVLAAVAAAGFIAFRLRLFDR